MTFHAMIFYFEEVQRYCEVPTLVEIIFQTYFLKKLVLKPKNFAKLGLSVRNVFFSWEKIEHCDFLGDFLDFFPK